MNLRTIGLVCAVAALTLPKAVSARFEPIRGTVEVGAKSVEEFHCQPSGAGSYPGVILLHGPEFKALISDYEWMCCDLAEHGYFAMYLEYMGLNGDVTERQFESYVEGMMGGHSTQLPSDAYLAVIGAGVDQLQHLGNVDADRIGIIGFSLGGSYGLRAAYRNPSVSSLVLFYTPTRLEYDTAENLIVPTLIIHGGDDKKVPVHIARELDAALTQRKTPHELRIYPSAGYEFNLRGAPQWYDDAAAKDAWIRTIEFLDKYLKEAVFRSPSSK